MIAVFYLTIAFFIGWGIKQIFRIDTLSLFTKISGGTNKHPPVWTFDFPFSLIIGVTILTTFNYYLSYVFSLFLPTGINPLLFADISLVPLCGLFFYFLYKKIIRKAHLPMFKDYFNKADSFYWKSIWFFGIFSIFLIFYSFFVYKGILHAGATVFSDFAPHTALISSFAKGNNFPTQYPHFANDGIQYHFFFFYLCGNLEYLGMRIELAMNIPSILGIISFTTLLGCLGVLLTKRRAVFFLAPLFLFFRSSYAIFSYLQELMMKKGATLLSIIKDIIKTNIFIGKTLHDDWGLMSMNVYPNQRHFLWGFSILLIILMIFIPFLSKPRQEGKVNYLLSPAFWKIKDFRSLVFCGITIACLPYWHGSAMIALFCILFVMAFFSSNRLAYIIVAGIGVLSALLQAKFFSGGAENVASPTFLWGFLADDKSLIGVIVYLIQLLGISILLILILPFLQKNPIHRILAFSFLAPLLFALCISLTPDVTVNHKYIIITVAMMNVFIADSLCTVWQFTRSYLKSLRPAINNFIANAAKETRIRMLFPLTKKFVFSISLFIIFIFITFSLCATGLVEMIGYINKNSITVNIELNSPLTRWVEENTDSGDIFLTAPYHFNEFFFSGRKAFYGWPYYSWSAGHDTASREVIVKGLFDGYGGDKEKFLEIARQNKIKYVIIDGELLNSDMFEVDVQFFKNNFTVVFTSPVDRNKTIYRLY